MLHDGGLETITGSVPGDLRLGICILYMRKFFEDPGDLIVVTLHDCSGFSFKNWDAEVAETDLAAIVALELDILRGTSPTDFACLIPLPVESSQGGVISLAARGFSLALDGGRAIELADLFAAATTYWNAFGNRGS